MSISFMYPKQNIIERKPSRNFKKFGKEFSSVRVMKPNEMSHVHCIYTEVQHAQFAGNAVLNISGTTHRQNNISQKALHVGGKKRKRV